MRLWTVQPMLFGKVLGRNGVIRADGRPVPQEWRRAYRWMADQCVRRGVLPRGRFPIWAWYAWGGAGRRRPDLRASWHLPRGTAGVRIELEIPDGAAVLSSFEGWHHVLNGWYVSRDARELAEIEKRRVAGRLRRSAIEGSWQRIFDLGFGSVSQWGPPTSRSVQACVGEVRSDWVRELTKFVAR